MSKQTEALKLALEAIEACLSAGTEAEDQDASDKLCDAYTAIREVLVEQPEQQGCMRCNTPKKCALHGCAPLTWPAEQPAPQQEPVAWMIWTHGPVLVFMNKDEASMEFDRLNHAYPEPTRMLVPLYTYPQPAQQDQGQSCYCPNCEALSKELAALKAQQQEPFKWSIYESDGTHHNKPAQEQSLQDLWHKVWPDAGAFVRVSADDLTQFAKAVSTSQQPAQQQEPVAWRTKNATPPGGYVVFQQYPQALADLGVEIEPLYTSPPASKSWAGLTNQELIDLTAIYSGAPLYCAIEAKLREKNA